MLAHRNRKKKNDSPFDTFYGIFRTMHGHNKKRQNWILKQTNSFCNTHTTHNKKCMTHDWKSHIDCKLWSKTRFWSFECWWGAREFTTKWWKTKWKEKKKQKRIRNQKNEHEEVPSPLWAMYYLWRFTIFFFFLFTTVMRIRRRTQTNQVQDFWIFLEEPMNSRLFFVPCVVRVKYLYWLDFSRNKSKLSLLFNLLSS